MRTFLPFIAVLFCLSIQAQTVTSYLKVTELPDFYSPLLDEIYVAGDFNGWEPGLDEYKLEDQGDGTYKVAITGEAGVPVEFKFTRGSWENVEGTVLGQFLPNRSIAMVQDYNFELEIAGWEDFPAPHTGTGNTLVLDSDFFIPQLDRNRRVWIWLPFDYEGKNTHYPVIYMQDGQNVFNEGTSFIGEWEVDESMEELSFSCNSAIVVAIDNGQDLRADEYSPWINEEFSAGGEGDEYIDFIIETLKPYMDSNYRTLPEPENTALAGSSLGALISLYGGIKHPEVFGKLGIFSPAYWFNPEIFDFVQDATLDPNQMIYQLAGALEGEQYTSQMQQMHKILSNGGIPSDNLKVIVHPDGEHSEWYWAREFSKVYQWLFCQETAVSNLSEAKFRVSPNPVSDSLRVVSQADIISISINDLGGNRVKNLSGLRTREIYIQVNDLVPGNYIMNILLDPGAFYQQKITVQ